MVSNTSRNGGAIMIAINRRRTMSIKNLYISFKDPNVKAICVTRWGGTDGGNAPLSTRIDNIKVPGVGGEITYEQAASVISLNGYFSGKTNIVSFKELYYFTNLTKFRGRDFKNCTSLEEITLPKNLQNLSFETFGNTALREITIPETVTSAEVVYIFSGCNSLKKMIILSSARLVWWGSCPVIEELVFGNKVTTLINRSCKKNTIGSIIWGSNMVTIEYEALSDRSYLSFNCIIRIPDTITTIGDNAFSNVTDLTDLIFECPNPDNYNTRMFGNNGPTGITNIWVNDNAYDYFYNRYNNAVRQKLKKLSDYPI